MKYPELPTPYCRGGDYYINLYSSTQMYEYCDTFGRKVAEYYHAQLDESIVLNNIRKDLLSTANGRIESLEVYCAILQEKLRQADNVIKQLMERDLE